MNREYAGFTLLEAVLALSVMMSILLFITPLFKQIHVFQSRSKEQAYMELQIGKEQLQYEIDHLYFVAAHPTWLEFRNQKPKDASRDNNEVVRIEKYGKMIRKTPGHHPIIMNVKKVFFEEIEGVIRMELKTTDEEDYVYFLRTRKE